jgi:hypothetical protein
MEQATWQALPMIRMADDEFSSSHRTNRARRFRLGECDRRTAESVARHVENLLAVKLNHSQLAKETCVWLTDIADTLKAKLVAVGLIEEQRRITLGEFVASWLEGKKAAGHKPTSLRAWRQTTDALTEHFGTRPLTTLNHADGEAFRAAMQAKSYRPTTIHKRLGYTKQILEDAVHMGQIPVNPWKHVRQRCGDPAERRAYVPVADAQRVIEFCPSLTWKLLVALARFGGLRVPSEAFSLT